MIEKRIYKILKKSIPESLDDLRILHRRGLFSVMFAITAGGLLLITTQYAQTLKSAKMPELELLMIALLSLIMLEVGIWIGEGAMLTAIGKLKRALYEAGT